MIENSTPTPIEEIINMPEIFISRHCATDWNLKGMLQGTQDISLCSTGRKEAYKISENIKKMGFTIIITSPLKRAYETSQIYSEILRIPCHLHYGLREIDHGDWECNKIEQLLSDNNSGYKNWLKNPTQQKIPNGKENIMCAQKRIIETLKNILYHYKNEKILIITHKHIRSLLKCTLLGLNLSNFADQISDDMYPIKLEDIEMEFLMNEKKYGFIHN